MEWTTVTGRSIKYGVDHTQNGRMAAILDFRYRLYRTFLSTFARWRLHCWPRRRCGSAECL